MQKNTKKIEKKIDLEEKKEEIPEIIETDSGDTIIITADDKKGIKQDMQNDKVYIRKDGVIHKPKPHHLKLMLSNKVYRVECYEDGAVFYDFDAYDARPQFKDLLNRQGQFLEVKLIFTMIGMMILGFFVFVVMFVFIPSESYFNKKFESIGAQKQSQSMIQSIQDGKTTQATGSSGSSMNVADLLLNK